MPPFASGTPRDAEVYVDGYYAGTVDDFDGTFQRLHIDTGGTKSRSTRRLSTLRQKVYLTPQHLQDQAGAPGARARRAARAEAAAAAAVGVRRTVAKAGAAERRTGKALDRRRRRNAAGRRAARRTARVGIAFRMAR
jgi:hypothetical protein